MTTIFSDGNFLIADKKTTLKVRHVDAIGNYTESSSNFTIEDSSKIYIPTKRITCKVGFTGRSRDVAALCIAGDASYAKKVMSVAEKGVNLFDVVYASGPFYFQDPGAILALCTDGTTVRITQTKDSDEISTNSVGAKNGLILGAGSGANRVRSAFTIVNVTKLTAMDAFTYAVYCDDRSNNRCDVYSLKEKRLFKDIRVSPKNLERVLKLLKDNTKFEKLLK